MEAGTKKTETTRSAASDGRARVIKASELSIKPGKHRDIGGAFAMYVRSLMQGWRQGTVKTKSRGEVAFSTKKPWKQKGTGRARVSSRRSPLWRKGGTIFGPQERTRTLKVNKSLKKAVFKALLEDRLANERVLGFDWSLEGQVPKTKQAITALKELGLQGKRVLLFVGPQDMDVCASFRNIPEIRLSYFDQPNAYSLAGNGHWLFLTKDLEHFNKMVSAWN